LEKEIPLSKALGSCVSVGKRDTFIYSGEEKRGRRYIAAHAKR